MTLPLDRLAKIGEGRQAEIFAIDAERVLRLWRDPTQRESRTREALAILTARDAGLPVPHIYEEVDVDGRPGLVMERLVGRDLLSQMEKTPWLAFRYALQSGRLHARIHETRGAGLPGFRPGLMAALESPLVPPEARARAVRALELLPDGDSLCHGDFHPGNILRSGRGDYIIDWPAASAGSPLADHARSLVLLSSAALPPGASRPMRALAKVGRRLVVLGYRRGYGQGERDLLARWFLVQATARLAEGIAEERAPLLRLLEADRSEPG